MKNYHVKSVLSILTICASALCSCEDKIDIDALRGAYNEMLLEEFNFGLTHDVTLNVDYGEMSGTAYIEVYEEDPLANATEEDQAPKGEVLFSAFLDENGSFHGKMNIPTCVEHIYVYSPTWGTPTLRKCDIVNDVASVFTPEALLPRSMTRAGGTQQYKIRPLNSSEITNTSMNYYTINGGWNSYGKTENENDLLSAGVLSSHVITDIQSKLWDGKTYKSGPYNNAQYRIENVNVQVLETYVDENGETQQVEDAEVWFTMLTEGAWNENSFGYYFYELGTTPDINNLRKYIILPNVSISGHPPYGLSANGLLFQASEAPTYTNMRVKLLYEDAQGNVSDRFPPKTEIGFFTLVNGFKSGSINGDMVTIEGVEYSTRKQGRISATAIRYDSDTKSKNDSRYIALSLPDESLVYGVEDGSDGSFEDILFTVSANPNKAIHTVADLAVGSNVETVMEKLTTTTLASHTYAYEDIWPSGGDYDMNDVAVEHTRTITYNQYNYVNKVVDKFVVKSFAGHQDGFAIQIDPNKRGTLILPDGAIDERSTNTIILTDDVRKVTGPIILTRELNGINKGDMENEELNPFIINYSLSEGSNSRVEVHLPNLPFTAYGNNGNGGVSTYYVDGDVALPYAIRIPDGNFELPAERVRIDQHYPNYKTWTKSKGKEAKDWYKKPKK